MINKQKLYLYLLIAYFLLKNFALFSQESDITISGIILNTENKCLPYASIGIKGKTIGTISNSSGDFVFHIPRQFCNDSLYISMMNYETFKAKVSDLKNTHSFYLTPKIYLLNEVSLHAYSAKQIVKKAFNNSNKNYHQKPALYDIYYREFWKKDSTFVRSIEASANMYYKGFQHSFNSIQSKIINVRKSKSYITNPQINNLDISFAFISGSFKYLKNNTYTIDSLTYFDGHLVYVITAINKKNQEWIKKYNYIKTLDDEAIEIETEDSLFVSNDGIYVQQLYITTDKFQILKIDMFYDFRNMKNRKPNSNNFITEYYNGSLSFKIYNDTAYFNYFKNHFYEIYYKNQEINDIDFISNLFYELYVTNIVTEKVKEIPKNEQPSDYDLYEQILSCEPDFWKSYNYIVDDSLRKKVFEDLEKLENKQNK